MKTLDRIFFRSFLLQAAWNYDLMQGAGYLYCIYPKLKELYGESGELAGRCLMHLNYFNTHPYMVPFVLGTGVRMEEEYRAGGTGPNSAAIFKLQIGGPLAALGDKIFWSTWRPLAGLLGVLMVFSGVRPYYIIPFGFLFIYNAPVLYFRYRALISSYSGNSDLVSVVRRINESFLSRLLPNAGLAAVFLCLAAALVNWGLARGVLLVFFTALSAVLRRRFKISAMLLLYLVSVLVITGSLILQ